MRTSQLQSETSTSWPRPAKAISWILPVLAVLTGCHSNDPTWALDITFVAPADSAAADITGSQTWQVYRKAWQRNFRGNHFLCSVFITFDGVASAADCPECVAAYTVTPEVSFSDCPDTLAEDATFASLERLGFGPVSDSVNAPYANASSPGYADYGLGWEVHGWAWPEGVPDGNTPEVTTFDGTQPFDMAPAFAWQLTPTGATSTSRLAVDAEGEPAL